MQVKICGITTLDAGLAAADAGADYLGFVFVPATRRFLAIDTAARLIGDLRSARRALPKLVGLFVDEPIDVVATTVERCGLDLVQLCGTEDGAFCRALGVPVIRMLRPQCTADLREFDEIAPYVERLLFDTYHAGAPGGSGVTGDWELAREVASRHSIILAGGLRPENVRAAIAAVQPWGVDTSSGVETDGKKNVDKISAFVSAAKRE